MIESGFVGLFRTIAIIIVVYYSFKIITRFLFPIFIRYMSKKHSKNFDKKSEKPPKRKNGKDENLGEYIDFEEIKD